MGKTTRRIGSTFRFLPGRVFHSTPPMQRDDLPVKLYRVVRRQPGDSCKNCAFYKGKFSEGEDGCVLSQIEKRFSTGWCKKPNRKVSVYFEEVPEDNPPTYYSFGEK